MKKIISFYFIGLLLFSLLFSGCVNKATTPSNQKNSQQKEFNNDQRKALSGVKF